MDYFYISLQVFIAISFFSFGAGCFLSKRASKEFKRYGLSDQQKVVGSLQILASIGLIIALGLEGSHFTTLIALCLTVMMIVATIVRIRINDPYRLMLPAFLYFIFCALLFYLSIF